MYKGILDKKGKEMFKIKLGRKLMKEEMQKAIEG